MQLNFKKGDNRRPLIELMMIQKRLPTHIKIRDEETRHKKITHRFIIHNNDHCIVYLKKPAIEPLLNITDSIST